MSAINRWMCALTVWVKGNPKRPIVLVLVSFLIIDWVIVDRWGIKGSVTDALTDGVIADAWVLAEFSGEEPLINIPYGPHPRNRTGKCMGTRVTSTDDLGRFRFDALTHNRPLANKSTFIIAFKPGWLTTTEGAEISSSLWMPSPHVQVALKHGPGERLSTTRRGPGFPWEKLPLHERTRSDELFGTERVVVEAMARCGPHGLPMAVAAMRHGLETATTFDERERMRGACRYAGRHALAGTNWPFDCENLPFKNPVSAEVLAVEAEVVADRRMRLEKYSRDPGQ